MISKIIPGGVKEYVRKRAGVPDMFVSMERLRLLGFRPSLIIDIGAYEGNWTKRCLKIFPDSKYLMVEALEKKKAILHALTATHTNVSLAMELLGANDGEEVYFSEIETASSVLDENAATHEKKKRTLKTLTRLLNERKLPVPDFIKLDVQGFELEILKGFKEHLPEVQVILMEVSLLDIHHNVPLIREVLNFMYDFGFVAFDICSVNTRRPLDGALWQTDLMFVKENSDFRKDKRYA